VAKNLVIVESPAKCKTIQKYLGSDYVVEASMGHLIDLPSKKIGVDVENNFKPEYVVIPARKKNLSALKKEAKSKDAIYLAADPDREGEAISWHLMNALQDDKKKFYRVSFDEITKDAVNAAFKNPRDIDMNLVNAQQARRILDRLVGYTLSPLLWKKVSRGLSAGRVQSVTVRLVVEREDDIKKFNAEEYWDIEAHLKRKGDTAAEKFSARLEKFQDKPVDLKKQPESEKVVEILKRSSYIVSDIRETKRKKKPSAPFTTSKLQQESFNKLRFSSVRTMHIAQSLYEGVEIGAEGSVGLITYMRTDSVRVSIDALAAAKSYVLEKYGKKYYPDIPNTYKSKKSAQEAHESIRPTLPLREPQAVKDYLTPDQLKLYTLIWNRFISSQMSESLLAQTTADIKAGDYLFRTSLTRVVFDGYSVLYEVEGEDDQKDKELKMPELTKDEPLDLLEIIPSQHFTKPPPRYSDASLVKALEELGIGRPSTYAPTISTVVTRDYVRRDAGYLKPTELGTIVTRLLLEHFPKVLDYEFTAKMEDELDGIEEGAIDWVTLLKSFYSPFMHTVDKAKLAMRDVKKEIVPTNEVCELCGKPMVIKWGRKGKFMSCSDFPTCKSAKSITSGVKCPGPGCTGELVERRSVRGIFFGCTKYPACTYTAKKLPNDEGKEEIT
jgi:DNA topoisomerase I, bacterial